MEDKKLADIVHFPWNCAGRLLENEARAQAVCMQTQDFREAYDAFSNKRPAQFQGK